MGCKQLERLETRRDGSEAYMTAAFTKKREKKRGGGRGKGEAKPFYVTSDSADDGEMGFEMESNRREGKVTRGRGGGTKGGGGVFNGAWGGK